MNLASRLCLLCLAGAARTVMAQTGVIAGRVEIAEKKIPLAGANVVLIESDRGVTTGPDGHYIIINVQPGTYLLRASFIGYMRTTVEEVRVRPNLTTTINFELKEEVLQGEEITIVASGHSINPEVSATLANMDAENLQSL